MGTVHIIETGVSNLASVTAALERLGLRVEVTRDPDSVATSSRVVLPGVGTFAAAMDVLRRLRIARPLAARLAEGRPTLAICLGLQVLAGESAEAPGRRGLAVFDGRCERFPRAVRTPHFGWNRIAAGDGCTMVADGHAYFANSYRLVEAPPGWNVAWCDHGGRFVAAVEREGVLACQFHPELSGPYGSGVLTRWLERTAC